jgi:hypothetical protein
MINLKLAEYNKDEKFQGFLELGKDFLFADYFIFIPKFGDGEYLDDRENGDQADPLGRIYRRDEKDPLKRFGGLFDGRTYGEGKFVLIRDDEDDIIQMGQHNYQRKFDDSDDKLHYLGAYILGNLHENPELYKKIK